MSNPLNFYIRLDRISKEPMFRIFELQLDLPPNAHPKLGLSLYPNPTHLILAPNIRTWMVIKKKYSEMDAAWKSDQNFLNSPYFL